MNHAPRHGPDVLPVELRAEDGVLLRGELRHGCTDWAVLAHDLGQDLDAWMDLPALLASRGLSVLALDLRGHGASDGEPEPERLGSDLRAAVEFAVQRGAQRVYVAGAGESAWALLSLPAGQELKVAGMAFLSPKLGALAGGSSPLPKLFVVGSSREEAAELDSVATGWSTVARVPSEDFGLQLLSGEWGDHVRDYVVRFFEGLRQRPPMPARPRMVASP